MFLSNIRSGGECWFSGWKTSVPREGESVNAPMQFFNSPAFQNFTLILSRLPNSGVGRLVKNFTNSLDCDAAAYLNRGPFS